MPKGVFVRTQECNRKNSESKKKLWSDPEERGRRVKALKKAWSDLEIRQRRVDAHNTSEAKKNHSEAKKKYGYEGFHHGFYGLVRETMFEMLGERCVECGEDMRVNVPHPHHLVLGEARFGILSESHKHSWKEILEEIEKCELRCEVCHGKIHKQQLKDNMVSSKESIENCF